MQILIYGNVADGFSFIGPFATVDAAADYAETSRNVRAEQWNVITAERPTRDALTDSEPKPGTVAAARKILTAAIAEPGISDHWTAAELTAVQMLIDAAAERFEPLQCGACGNAPATRQRAICDRGMTDVCEYCAGRIDSDSYHKGGTE